MTTAICGFHGATDLGDVRKAMTKLLTEAGAYRPVALFYGSPSCRVMRDVVLPNIQYYHYRSRNNAECFCMGYVPLEDEFHTSTTNPEHDMFMAKAFADAVKELEDHTAWKYMGQTELILLNAYRAPRSDRANLDFKTVISFCLEEAETLGAIRSANQFLEEFFHFAFNYNGSDFIYDFSDHLGLREAASSLKQVFFGFFGSPLKEAVPRALTWYVKDFSNVEVFAAALKFVDESDESILEAFPEDLGKRVLQAKKQILCGDC